MKYEDWIKYEENRKQQSAPLIWSSLPPEPKHPAKRTPRRTPEPLQRTWAIIVQLFSSLPI